jgi:thioredoxin 1
MTVTELTTKADFDALLEKSTVVVVQASAAWCGPCKAITPIYNKLAGEHASDKFAFAHFDTDEVPDLAQELGISSLPTFTFFENKEKGDEVKGAIPPKLQAAVQGYAEKAKGEGALKTDEDF